MSGAVFGFMVIVIIVIGALTCEEGKEENGGKKKEEKEVKKESKKEQKKKIIEPEPLPLPAFEEDSGDLLNEILGPGYARQTAVSVTPTVGRVTDIGDVSLHILTNEYEERLVFNVEKTGREYRVKAVYGFIQPFDSIQLELIKIKSSPRKRDVTIKFAAVGPDATDAQAAFKSLLPTGNVTIQKK